MIKTLALPLIILASSVNFSLAQDWQDSYPRISFSSLIEQCESIMGEEALTCETTCFNYCGKLDMKYEVEFTYIGTTSALKGTKKRYIENWLKTYFGDKYNGFYQHEISFSNDSINYKIAVQEATLPYYAKELLTNDSVYLYLMYAGTLVEDDEVQHIFVANDFLKKED